MDEQMQPPMSPPPMSGFLIPKPLIASVTHGVFDWEECEWLIDWFEQNYEDRGDVGRVGNQPVKDDVGVVEETRKVKNIQVDLREIQQLNPQLMMKIYQYIDGINTNQYQFDLGMITQMEILKYEDGGHYRWHTDTGPEEANFMRKLSTTIELSDPDDYEGGELLVADESIINAMHDLKGKELKEFWKNALEQLKGLKEQGTAVTFPSWLMHRVMPVTKGVRYAVVIWANGPRIK